MYHVSGESNYYCVTDALVKIAYIRYIVSAYDIHGWVRGTTKFKSK